MSAGGYNGGGIRWSGTGPDSTQAPRGETLILLHLNDRVVFMRLSVPLR